MDFGRPVSRGDIAAHEALRQYRESIGLEAELPTATNPNFERMGRWIDGLAPWEIFVTGTFRPIRRRWGNPRNFATLESTIKPWRSIRGFRTRYASNGDVRYAQSRRRTRFLKSRDYLPKVASILVGPQYVRGFFGRFVASIENDLCCWLSYFVGLEAGRVSGMNHFHALITVARADAPFEFYRRGLWNWLHKNAGRSLILPFEKDKGAGWYLSAAYVGKRPLGWDVHVDRKTHESRRPKPGGHASPVAPSAELPRDFFHLTQTRWHR